LACRVPTRPAAASALPQFTQTSKPETIRVQPINPDKVSPIVPDMPIVSDRTFLGWAVEGRKWR
jgi:hypothetical protein